MPTTSLITPYRVLGLSCFLLGPWRHFVTQLSRDFMVSAALQSHSGDHPSCSAGDHDLLAAIETFFEDTAVIRKRSECSHPLPGTQSCKGVLKTWRCDYESCWRIYRAGKTFQGLAGEQFLSEQYLM